MTWHEILILILAGIGLAGIGKRGASFVCRRTRRFTRPPDKPQRFQ